MEAEPYLVNEVSDEDVKHLRALADQAARFGITSMQIMSSMSVDRFARLLVKADLPIRIRAIPFPMTTVQGRDLSEIRQLSKLRFPDSKVTVSGIKWISTVATSVVEVLRRLFRPILLILRPLNINGSATNSCMWSIRTGEL